MALNNEREPNFILIFKPFKNLINDKDSFKSSVIFLLFSVYKKEYLLTERYSIDVMVIFMKMPLAC